MGLSKFSSLKNVLCDNRIQMETRLRYLNCFVRSRLTYSAATWDLSKAQYQKIESVWCRLLRRMINKGFKRNADFSMVFTNNDVYRITGSEPIEHYIQKQQLRWVGHVCRMGNQAFQKRLLFSETAKFKRDLWIKLEKNSGFDRSQLRKLMMDRQKFSSWLNVMFR